MADFKEINYKNNPHSTQVPDTTSNGASNFETDNGDAFPDSGGKIYFIDTEGELQKLTFTQKGSGASDYLDGVSGWTGTGNLYEFTTIYGDYYVPSSTTITERPTGSAHTGLAGSGYDLDDTYIFGLLHVFTERVIS